MPLENLLTLIENLRERIDSHGDALRQSEALTRYTLIDPLLRELGWDTEDPDMVVPEYSSGGGRVDYALCKNGKSVIMLEAKKLDKSLKDAVNQGINYCMHEGTKYFAVTDGRCWEIYETHKPVPIDKKRIVSFDLKDPLIVDVCLKALALWRRAVVSDQIVVGQVPIASPTTEQPNTTEEHPEIPVIETTSSRADMLDKQAKEITRLYDEINDNKPEDMKMVHAFGRELNKAKVVFEGQGWGKFVTDTCEVDIKKARRSMRIARMLTVEKAVEEGSINKAYLKCREMEANNTTPIKDHFDTPVIGSLGKTCDNAATIPSPKEKTEVSQTRELIDINQATAKELERLSTIGPQTAKRIVAYREENGPFKHIEDITKVEDIGIKTFEHLKSHITLSTL